MVERGCLPGGYMPEVRISRCALLPGDVAATEWIRPVAEDPTVFPANLCRQDHVVDFGLGTERSLFIQSPHVSDTLIADYRELTGIVLQKCGDGDMKSHVAFHQETPRGPLLLVRFFVPWNDGRREATLAQGYLSWGMQVLGAIELARAAERDGAVPAFDLDELSR